MSQYGWGSKEDKDEYQRKDYTDECLNQYRRVLKEDTDEYPKKVLTRTGVWINTQEYQSKYRRVLRKRLTDECLS